MSLTQRESVVESAIMRSSPLAPRTAAAVSLFSLVFYVSAQSVPGARYLRGGGAPGAAPYELVDDYSPNVFFDKFNFYSSYDPTYGHVQYVNESVATANGYAAVSDDGTVIMKPDTTNKWPRGGLGRPSVRVISDNTYYHGLFIIDILHMPWGCGTWPAYWLLGPDWPNNGEIGESRDTLLMNVLTCFRHHRRRQHRHVQHDFDAYQRQLHNRRQLPNCHVQAKQLLRWRQ